MAAGLTGRVSSRPTSVSGFPLLMDRLSAGSTCHMPATPSVSLVIPVRNEAGNIAPLLSEIRTALDAAGERWEVTIVDDGSTDTSWSEISAASEADPRVRGIRLEVGQGKSAALAKGFAQSTAPRVVMLDGDGQDDPAEIPAFLALLDEGADLVNGWKSPRRDPLHKTLPSRVFNLLVGLMTGLWLHDHNCGLKAFRREVLAALPLQGDMHRFITVLAASRGFRIREKTVHHRPRGHGRTKYGSLRFLTGLIDLVQVAGRIRAITAAAREQQDPAAVLRRRVGILLTVVACGLAAGRIGAVSSIDRIALEKRLVSDAIKSRKETGGEVDEQAIRDAIRRDKGLMRPFLSANDRSRWLTIRSLVERGSFTIEDLVAEPGWDTIDAVVHNDADGVPHLYSSKPPLLPLLLAGPYWVATKFTGWTLADHPFELGRALMLLYGILPLAVTMLFTQRLVERIGRTDWGRFYGMILICFGTYLSTFSVVLNNHLPAAACVAISAWGCWRICVEGTRSGWLMAGTALAAAFAATFDLPALAWTAFVTAALLWCDPRRALLAAAPAMLLVAAASAGANYAAHGTIEPAYAHRRGEESWYDYRFELPNGKVIESYWRSPAGVDRGEPSAVRYAWHSLVGHHGIFSLTPAWLLVPCGLLILAIRAPTHRRLAAIAVGLISLTVIAFYLTRSPGDRNYGGVCSGFRWVFWLVPLWVTAAVPAADAIGRSRLGRGFAATLLGFSALSVAYPTWNPWIHPWIFEWMSQAGWLPQ
jgi:hypothetical protein